MINKYFLKFKMFVMIVFSLFLIYNGIIMLKSSLDYDPPYLENVSVVKGTIKSFGKVDRYFQIRINEDKMTYSIETFYYVLFKDYNFEYNVKVGDEIEMYCGNYMGDTIFDFSKISQASIYAIKVNGYEYMSLDDSIERYNQNNSLELDFLIPILMGFTILTYIYFFSKKQKRNKYTVNKPLEVIED